ncbi:MAG: YDG domain-containing protein [Clostridiaceae bacterium]
MKNKRSLSFATSIVMMFSIMLSPSASVYADSVPESVQYNVTINGGENGIATDGTNTGARITTQVTEGETLPGSFGAIANNGYKLDGFSYSDIKQISAGVYHTIILKNDGTVWAAGSNSYGQLGLGDINNTNIFIQVPGMDNVKDIFTGKYHTMILKDNGEVWATGYNYFGQLGLGDKDDRNIFTQVSEISDVKDISTGGLHTMILKIDNTVWATGMNAFGQLGLGDKDDRNIFTKVEGMADVKAISTCSNSTIILKIDGTVWGAGANGFGQLGLGEKFLTNIFIKIPGVSGVKAISNDYNHAMILKENGEVWATGKNDAGQLGLGDLVNRNTFTQVTGMSDVKDISEGLYHTMILKDTGEVWATGANNNGELGIGDNDARNIFTQVSDMSDVKAIYAGDNHTIILKNDNTVWSTGINSCGQLGLGDRTNRNTFTEVTQNIPTITTDLSTIKIQKDMIFTAVYSKLPNATVTMSNDISKIYDGTAVSVPTYTSNSEGAVEIEYKEKDADDNTYDEVAPVNAGSYTVRVSAASDNNYYTASTTEDFTISKKDIGISEVTVNDKIYDGNANAIIASSGELSSNYDGDNLTIVNGVASFVSKDVANNISVMFSGFTLGGSAKDNYNLTEQPLGTTANINKKALTVIPDFNQSKIYGQADPVLKYSYIGNILGEVPLLSGSLSRNSGNDIGSYAINQNDLAIIDNGSFLANNYMLVILTGANFEIKEYNVEEKAVLNDPQGINNWYTSSVSLTAPDGFNISNSNALTGNTWSNSLTLNNDDGILKSATYYLKRITDGAISKQLTSDEYKVDKTNPVISGAIDSSKYFIGRVINADDSLGEMDKLVYTKDDGEEVTFTSGKFFDSPGSYTITAKDMAGNEAKLNFQIKVLPSLEDITYTDSSKNLIEDIRQEYDDHEDLSEPYKTNMDNEIKALETKYTLLDNEVKDVKEKTHNLPEASEITREDKDQIIKASESYEKLNDDQKRAINEEELNKLNAAIEALILAMLYDKPTDTTVAGVDGTYFNPAVYLVVIPIAADGAESKTQFKSAYSNVEKASKTNEELNEKELVALYDVSLFKGSTKVQPDGKIKVKIKIPDNLIGREGLDIIYIADDGEVTPMHATIEGEYLVFITTHFSDYAIVAKPLEESNDTIIEQTGSPMDFNILLLFGILISLLGAVVIKKQYKRN